MSHYSVKPIRLDLRPSTRLTAILLVATIAACGAITVLPLPLWAQLTSIAVIIAAATFHILRDARLRLRSSILALEVGSDGTLRVLTRAEGWCDAKAKDESFVTPALTIVALAFEERFFSRHAVIFADSADTNAFRRMRVWLRWGRKESFHRSFLARGKELGAKSPSSLE
ncbi:MAG: hypothetical protein LBV44_07585 [Methylobacillus sp.]|jgi:toxin CptA|nr:hypothetical protein [Methylobacillus sp.]